MGLCFSSETCLRNFPLREITAEHGGVGAAGLGKLSSFAASVNVIGVGGNVECYSEPIKAKEVISKNPNCFLCSSETMSVGSRVPGVPDDEDLKAGQIYFLMPRSREDSALTLPELCELAIATSSVLDGAAVELLRPPTTVSRFG